MHYYLGDGLGSVMKTTDDTGAVVNSYEYDVYGTVTSSSGSQASEFEFAGEQTDPSGLQYLRARYYDPATGTFISREPMALIPGWSGHPHAYASGNPARFVDPTGEVPVDGDGCQEGEVHCIFTSSCGYARAVDPYGAGQRCDWDANHCHFLPLGQGIECLGPNVSNVPLLVGEYAKNVYYGCQADKKLCAAAIGTSAFTWLFGRILDSVTVMGCGATAAPTAGLGCVALITVNGVIQRFMFKTVNTALMNELMQKGREARRER